MRIKCFLTLLTILFFISCNPEEKADLIIHNANVYTVDENNPRAKAIAVKDGRILAVGDDQSIMELKGDNSKLLNAEGQFLMPGFIEGHGHFSGVGYSLIHLNFMNSKTWDEIVAMVEEKVKESEPGEWIIGRGWHQEKWIESPPNAVHGYPYHDKLSEVSPDNPVFLRHASGHSSFANKKAMDLAGLSPDSPNPKGGEIVRDKDGYAVGVFEERAQSIIGQAYQAYLNKLSDKEREDEWYRAIELAQDECLKKGVTSFQDAGSSFESLERYNKMAEEGKLRMRLWVMMRHSSEQMRGKVIDYRVIDAGNHFYTCRAIKSEVDGALGAFGAWLLEPYNDKPGFLGQNTTDIEEVARIAELAYANDMQLCVHAIGDRANREVLDIFEDFTTKAENQDLRWRIEHAQHLSVDDIPRFSELDVIASMQGIHCTSDAPYVEKRLGFERAKYGAYAWRSILDSGAKIANGTDAPVEDVDPLISFYASVTRKRIDNGMEFFTEQSMTREEAIKSYTLDNAYAAFEEEHKGSIIPGKLADFIIVDKDLIQCEDQEILDANIIYTIVDGNIAFKKT